MPAFCFAWQCIEQTRWHKLPENVNIKHIQTLRAVSKKQEMTKPKKTAVNICGYYSKHCGVFLYTLFYNLIYSEQHEC